MWPLDDLSNQTVLKLTLMGFLVFVFAQGAATILSGSLSLLGDTAAMSVDVVAYGVNMFAESSKAQADISTFHVTNPKGLERWRMHRLWLETIAPSISVLCLISVAIYIAIDASIVLRNIGESHSQTVSSNVEDTYMFVFAGGNLILDLICSSVFLARGSEIFLEKPDKLDSVRHIDKAFEWENDLDENEFGELEFDDEPTFNGVQNKANQQKSNENNSFSIYGLLQALFPSIFLHETPDHSRRKNLNMIAAFTHVSGDMFRTISVLIAASVSFATGIPAETCDAYAAIVVTISLVALVIPLIKDIVTNTRDIYHSESPISVKVGNNNMTVMPIKDNISKETTSLLSK